MSWNRITAFLLSCVFTILAACDESPTEPTVSLPATVQLQVGQSTFFSSDDLVVRFIDVPQDSRCPDSPVIDCAWEGEAVVRVQLTTRGRILGAPLLSTHPNNGSSPNAVRLEGYLLRVIQLDPYPVDSGSIPQAEYRLMLRVERE